MSSRWGQWSCPRCGTQPQRFEDEGSIRDVCWLCWVAEFPTREEREAELVRRGMPPTSREGRER